MRSTILRAGLPIAMLTLAGCAAAPSDIPPSYVGTAVYNEMSCEELISEKRNLEVTLADLSSKQSASRARGIAYNLILLPGLGALSKDRAEAIGQVKGRILAVEESLLKCRSD